MHFSGRRRAEMTNSLGFISELWRYPVKSMGGETVERVTVDERGVIGDRAFVVHDAAGKVASAKANKQFRHMGRLLDFAAMTFEGKVIIVFPDGRTFDARDRAVDEALSAVCGTRLTVRSDDDISHRDVAPLHIVGKSSLRRLRFYVPAQSVSARRFRPNFVVAGESEAPPEDEWIGRTVGVGADVRIRVIQRTFRCITVALANAELPREPSILRVLADHSQGRLGVFAEVTRGGTVHCDDEIYFAADEPASVPVEEATEAQRVIEPPSHPDATLRHDVYIPLGSIARRLPLLHVHCERCGLHSLYRTEALIQKYGTEPNLSIMREAVTADCPHHRERALEGGESCAPLLPDLPGWL